MEINTFHPPPSLGKGGEARQGLASFQGEGHVVHGWAVEVGLLWDAGGGKEGGSSMDQQQQQLLGQPGSLA